MSQEESLLSEQVIITSEAFSKRIKELEQELQKCQELKKELKAVNGNLRYLLEVKIKENEKQTQDIHRLESRFLPDYTIDLGLVKEKDAKIKALETEVERLSWVWRELRNYQSSLHNVEIGDLKEKLSVLQTHYDNLLSKNKEIVIVLDKIRNAVRTPYQAY
jgi:chromosome segregation ATPase